MHVMRPRTFSDPVRREVVLVILGAVGFTVLATVLQVAGIPLPTSRVLAAGVTVVLTAYPVGYAVVLSRAHDDGHASTEVEQTRHRARLFGLLLLAIACCLALAAVLVSAVILEHQWSVTLAGVGGVVSGVLFAAVADPFLARRRERRTNDTLAQEVTHDLDSLYGDIEDLKQETQFLLKENGSQETLERAERRIVQLKAKLRAAGSKTA